ncbi:MAG TPA: glycosyltransferase family 2 protein [Ktedonobacteraceae bacterium]
MTITVLIPTRNRAHLLEKTLVSLTLQRTRDFRVIVVDHASTDETGKICERYQTCLPLSRYWLAYEKDAPAHPRHFGMQQVQTPLVVFVDCGIVVPTFFIGAHLAFHQQHERHIGAGLFHGRSAWNEHLSALVERMTIDQAQELLLAHPELADVRQGDALETSHVPWMYGWTANLSLRTRDYWDVDGFNLNLAYAFEDIELCYRLFRYGVRFAWVQEGWGIHLPHRRLPARILRKMEYLGREQVYRELRTLGLEVLFYSDLSLQAGDATFHYLSEVGRDCAQLPSTAPLVASHQFEHPSLLIGGTLQDAPLYDYLTLSNEEITSTASIWSCCGLHIPLGDQELRSVIISDIWKWLNCAFNRREISLLECMIAEIKRTADYAYFVDSPARMLPRQDHTPVAELSRLCQLYDLPFQIIGQE